MRDASLDVVGIACLGAAAVAAYGLVRHPDPVGWVLVAALVVVAAVIWFRGEKEQR